MLFISVLAGGIFLCSCENDIEKINTVTGSDQIPDVSGKMVEIMYSDSGKLKVMITAPEVKVYEDIKEPYTEFPAGMTTRFYDDSLTREAEITAGNVVYYKKKKLWEAKNDVRAINLKNNETLNTEHMFWDEKEKIIYSDAYSRIVNENGVFYGKNGFEANQNLTHWKLIGSKGTVNIKDEQETE